MAKEAMKILKVIVRHEQPRNPICMLHVHSAVGQSRTNTSIRYSPAAVIHQHYLLLNAFWRKRLATAEETLSMD